MASPPILQTEGVTLRNLKAAMYKMSVQPIKGRVTSMASHAGHVIVGIANQGCYVYKLLPSGSFEEVVRLANSGVNEDKNKMAAGMPPKGTSVFDIAIAETILLYIKEVSGAVSLCVHDLSAVLAGNPEPRTSLTLARRAPMLLAQEQQLIVIGGAAWTTSWTTDSGDKDDAGGSSECHLRSLSTGDLSVQREWKVTDNSVGLLRYQSTPEHCMVGVADTRTGLKVYDIAQPTESAYECLYQVPVEEIRNFQLVGNFVGVFHKFEPNVSFWNMKEQKTILCINIQDQMKELAEEFLEEEDEDLGLYGDDDDHVSAVTSVRSDSSEPNADHILLYGTKSGCIFGMSVASRSKLFNIPCPHELSEGDGLMIRRDVAGLCYVGDGKVVVAYEKQGLTVLDFSPENPPDRPPTRHQKRQ